MTSNGVVDPSASKIFVSGMIMSRIISKPGSGQKPEPKFTYDNTIHCRASIRHNGSTQQYVGVTGNHCRVMNHLSQSSFMPAPTQQLQNHIASSFTQRLLEMMPAMIFPQHGPLFTASQFDSLGARNHLYDVHNASDYITWSDDGMAMQRPFGVAEGVDIGMVSHTTFKDNDGELGRMLSINESRKL